VKNLWDVRNRLVEIDQDGDDLTIAGDGSSSGAVNDNGDVRYAYTDGGHRIGREIIGEGTTYFVIDDRNPTGYAQVLEERVSVDGVPERTYVLGLDVIAQADDSGEFTYLGYDGHGSVRLVTDEEGDQLSGTDYDYDAYGNAIGFTAGAAVTSLLYAGEYWDGEKGSYFLRGRPSYDPVTGRFTTQDVIIPLPGDTLNANLYLYASANPVYYTDPTGERVFSVVGQFVLQAINATLRGIKEVGTAAAAHFARLSLSRAVSGMAGASLLAFARFQHRTSTIVYHVTDNRFVKSIADRVRLLGNGRFGQGFYTSLDSRTAIAEKTAHAVRHGAPLGSNSLMRLNAPPAQILDLTNRTNQRLVEQAIGKPGAWERIMSVRAGSEVYAPEGAMINQWALQNGFEILKVPSAARIGGDNFVILVDRVARGITPMGDAVLIR
jgi:RHS repeat-associated protein